MIKIRKDVPCPPARLGSTYSRRSEVSCALDAMEVGDSFVWPDEQANQSRVSAYVSVRGGRRRYVTRKTREGITVWRTE